MLSEQVDRKSPAIMIVHMLSKLEKRDIKKIT